MRISHLSAANLSVPILRESEEILRTNGRYTAVDQSNKNYLMTHGVSGVDWQSYKHPLPEQVYDVYMQYWRDVEFKSSALC